MYGNAGIVRLAVEQPTKDQHIAFTVFNAWFLIAILHDETHNAILAEVSSGTMTKLEVVQRVGAYADQG